MTGHARYGWAVLAILCGCGQNTEPSRLSGGIGSADLTSTLAWGACDTSRWPDGYPLPAAGVVCTMVNVPLDWQAPKGPALALTVARQPARRFPTGKAVFQLAGGPGGSSVAQSGIVPRYFPGLLDDFDLVYVDQRGTGGSGYLDCSQGYPGTFAEWSACGAEHASDPLDNFLTEDAARDLDQVRAALGYDKIWLRGGSYGTRLGLEYMRLFGDNVVAAVLDGLAGPDFDLVASVTRELDLGVEWLIEECLATPACLAVSPTLADDINAWRTKVAQDPRPILIDGQETFEDEGLFVGVLAQVVDWDELRYRFPRAIHLALQGDYALWDLLLTYVMGSEVTEPTKVSTRSVEAAMVPWSLDRSLRPVTLGVSYVAPGLYGAVACAEWVPNTTPEAAFALAAEQLWDDGHFLGFMEACAAWHVAPLSVEMRRPVLSSVKTLLTSGQFDARTPVSEGEHVQAGLANSVHVVVPFANHSTMGVPCVAEIMTQFIKSNGDTQQVDTRCLSTITHPAW